MSQQQQCGFIHNLAAPRNIMWPPGARFGPILFSPVKRGKDGRKHNVAESADWKNNWAVCTSRWT
jgi:hypothetical protein